MNISQREPSVKSKFNLETKSAIFKNTKNNIKSKSPIGLKNTNPFKSRVTYTPNSKLNTSNFSKKPNINTKKRISPFVNVKKELNRVLYQNLIF